MLDRGCEKEYPFGPGYLSPRVFLEGNSFEGQPEERGRNTKVSVHTFSQGFVVSKHTLPPTLSTRVGIVRQLEWRPGEFSLGLASHSTHWIGACSKQVSVTS